MQAQSLQEDLDQKLGTAWKATQNDLQDAVHEPHTEARDTITTAIALHPGKRFQRWARRLAGCSSIARFYIDPEHGKVRPWLNRCRHKLCPFCAKARSYHVADNLFTLLTAMPQPRMIVLTVKSTDADLTEQLTSLRTWFRKLRHTSLWKKAVTGGAYTLEITMNRQTCQWHPHLHIIYDGEYFPQKVLQAAWQKITGGSRIVWIQKVTDKQGAARELAKYIGKPQRVAELSYKEIREYALAVNGTRMVQTFGSKYNIAVQDEDPGEPNAPETYQVGLARLVFLAARGAETPLRIVALIAERWPLLGRFVHHRMPQIAPDLSPTEKTARLYNLLNERSPPPENKSPPGEKSEMLDAKIFLAFTKYRQENEQGAYAHYDLYEA